MTDGPQPISPEARRALERELAELRADRAKVAATLRSEDPVGDRADEADELQRADDVARLDERIGAIEGRLREGAVAGPPPADAVGVGQHRHRGASRTARSPPSTWASWPRPPTWTW
ncbi:hypothetical protein [Streptomyces showdoensis]|uniref:hypothetical protein n=1 Tax=Streptomyces showdoensis TaxID=68268 RepID=UPI0031EDA4EF